MREIEELIIKLIKEGHYDDADNFKKVFLKDVSSGNYDVLYVFLGGVDRVFLFAEDKHTHKQTTVPFGRIDIEGGIEIYNQVKATEKKETPLEMVYRLVDKEHKNVPKNFFTESMKPYACAQLNKGGYTMGECAICHVGGLLYYTIFHPSMKEAQTCKQVCLNVFPEDELLEMIDHLC